MNALSALIPLVPARAARFFASQKAAAALQHLADGRPLPEAAALARMTAPSLRLALRKPHLLTFLLGRGSLGCCRRRFRRLSASWIYGSAIATGAPADRA